MDTQRNVHTTLSLESKGRPHREGNEARVTVYTDAQTHCPVRSMNDETYYF